MIDVTVKVKDEKWVEGTGFLSFTTTVWNKAGSWENVNPFFKKITVNPTKMYVRGDAVPQGLLNADNTWNSTLDYSTVGAKIKLPNSNGVVVAEQNLNKLASVIVENAPATGETYTVAIDMPGHFTYYHTTTLTGHLAYLRSSYLVAGDVNKDNVNDIFDALTIKEKWGTNNREADINNDGVVNGKGLNFVKINYLKQNSSLEYLKPGSSPDPKS